MLILGKNEKEAEKGKRHKIAGANHPSIQQKQGGRERDDNAGANREKGKRLGNDKVCLMKKKPGEIWG